MKKYRSKQQFLYSQTAIQLLFFYLAALQIFTEKIYPLFQHVLLKCINGLSPPASPCFSLYFFFSSFFCYRTFEHAHRSELGGKLVPLLAGCSCSTLIFDICSIFLCFVILFLILLVCQDKDRYASRRWYHSTLVWIPEIKVSISALAQYSAWAH